MIVSAQRIRTSVERADKMLMMSMLNESWLFQCLRDSEKLHTRANSEMADWGDHQCGSYGAERPPSKQSRA